MLDGITVRFCFIGLGKTLEKDRLKFKRPSIFYVYVLIFVQKKNYYQKMNEKQQQKTYIRFAIRLITRTSEKIHLSLQIDGVDQFFLSIILLLS